MKEQTALQLINQLQEAGQMVQFLEAETKAATAVLRNTVASDPNADKIVKHTEKTLQQLKAAKAHYRNLVKFEEPGEKNEMR